jgi:hypothetical protein
LNLIHPYNDFLISFKIKIKKMYSGVTTGGGTAYPSGAPEFTPGF